MKPSTFGQFLSYSITTILILLSSLNAQDTLLFFSDSTVMCYKVDEPDISCSFKYGPGEEDLEWTLADYSVSEGWSTPLMEPEIGNWSLTPVNYPNVHWIWPRNSNGLSCEHAFFRFSFSIPDSMLANSGSIEISVDNEYIVYLNGIEIGNDGDCQNPFEGDIWKTSETYQIPTELFNNNGGENILSVHGYDNWSIAGLRYQFQIILEPYPFGLDEFRSDLKLNSIHVSPNPFDEKTILTFHNKNHSNYTLSIFNLSSKKVFAKNHFTSNKIEFERGNLPNGVYIVELKGEQVFRGKMVVK